MTDTHPHTIASAAHHLGVSPRTIQRRLAAGELDAVKVHTAKGRGYEWRIRLDGDATPDVTTPAPSPATLDVTGSGKMTAATRTTLEATPDVAQVLTALAESMQERQALALRLGQVEAERAALQAALQSRRRWWRFWERD